MQNVSFIIRRAEQVSWLPVIQEIEKHGYKVEFKPQDSKLTFVLSGSYVNPLAIPHKRILICHSQEWGKVWDSVYKHIMNEYYDKVINIKSIPLDMMMKEIGGLIETSEPRGQN